MDLFLKHSNLSDGEASASAMQLVFLPILPVAIKASIQLDIFEIIAKSGSESHLSASQIVSQIPDIKNPEAEAMVDRILRLLASFSILKCSLGTKENGGFERLYGLTPVSKYFVQDQDGLSLAPLLQLSQDMVFATTWDHMKEAVVNGGNPFQNVYGMSSYEYSALDPRFSTTFNKAMQGHTTMLMKKILETYKGFEQLGQLMDVAGGTGANLSLITAKNPNIKGINFDLPHVVADAPTFPGVEHVGGDMFTTVPTAKTIFLKWILHNWSDEQCVKLLKNCYASLPEHGKMIVVESVASSATEANVWATSVFLIDVKMMQYYGGKERSHEEFEALAKEAGFCGIKAVCCVNTYTVMEFYKKV